MPDRFNSYRNLFETIEKQDAMLHEVESGTSFIQRYDKLAASEVNRILDPLSVQQNQHLPYSNNRNVTGVGVGQSRLLSTAAHGTLTTSTSENEENRQAFERLINFPQVLARLKLKSMSDTQIKMYRLEVLAASRKIFEADFINNLTFLKRWFTANEIKHMKTCLGIRMPRREGKTEEMKAFAVGWLVTQRTGNVCTFHPRERNSQLFLKGVEELLRQYVSKTGQGVVKREGDEELKYRGPYTIAHESFLSCFSYPVLTIENCILKTKRHISYKSYKIFMFRVTMHNKRDKLQNKRK